MSHFSLESLRSVLEQQDAQKRQKQDAAAPNKVNNNNSLLRQALDAVWEDCRQLRRPKQQQPPNHTMDDGTTNLHHDDDSLLLFGCPISPPRQTLVPLQSLPRAIQDTVMVNNSSAPATSASDNDTMIVQVPWDYLDGGEEGAAAAADSKVENDATTTTHLQHQHRPLHGNLTSKLSEYTRGMSGRAQPFRPGGEPATPAAKDEDNNNDLAAVAATHPEQVERSNQVLALTTTAEKESSSVRQERYENKEEDLLSKLITAPPGVDFEVGLGYEHVYGSSSREKEKESSTMAEAADEYYHHHHAPEDRSSFSAAPMPQQQQQPKVTENMFARSFFDDDSLFGSSSSSSSGSDEEDDQEEEEQGDGADMLVEEEAALVEQEEAVKAKDGDSGGKATRGDDDAQVEDLDLLLQELTLSADQNSLLSSKNKKAVGGGNPLELAQRQAQHQHDDTRKSWASTKTLPIPKGQGLDSHIANPAMSFPFVLDDFQQQAVARLERSESVFVAAHTSAGKTVVAEYAIALAKQRATRCVYTSPIKALSNQKFRDFGLKFGVEHVGLVTGDLQVNVDNSTVLILTTEILRSMLYRGADLIRDIEFCIFDEVHYINDSERGVVWEEVIIMLPSYVNLIFLSATTPNTLEFSDWIGKTKRKPVHVVKTNYRPVPLAHFLWAGTKLHKVLEGNGPFLDKGYAEAANALLPVSMRRDGSKNNNNKNKKGGKQQQQQQQQQKSKPPPRRQTGSKQMAWQAQGSKQNWMSLVRFLDRESLTPCVVFSFSKKKCEEIAHMLQSLDLNTAKERSVVQGFTIQAVARLSENDSRLPQVLTICEMAKRGIGVHHGGLLPILKEMVEILFSRNLIKVLLATETFAIGVNMPARAVVFNSLRKHDGTQFRSLEPGEYTQMSGRAGRRGLDKVGTVIMCCFGETPPPQQMLRTILTGRSTTLRSQFRLTYNMILNLLRVEEMSVESMIKRSFSEFATQRALTANEYPKLLARGFRTLEKMEEQLGAENDNRIGAEDMEDYFGICKEILETTKDVLGYLRESEGHTYSDDLLPPGRIILVSAARQHGVVRAPAIVLRSGPRTTSSGTSSSSMGLSKGAGGDASSSSCLVCLVLMPPSFAKDDEKKGGQESPSGTIGFVGSSRQRYYSILEIAVENVLLVSNWKHKIDPNVLLKDSTSVRGSDSLGRSAGDPFAGMKPLGKKRDDDPFAGMKPLGKKRDDDNPFAGMKAVGKKDRGDDDFFGKAKPLGKKGRDQADDFFGKAKPLGKKGRDDGDFFGKAKPLGKKGRDDDDFFGKAKPLGKKGKGDEGFGAAKEDQMLDDTIKFLLKTEQAEVQDLNLPSIDLRSFLKRGSDVVYYRRACDRLQELTAMMRSSPTHRHPSLESLYSGVERREQLRKKVSTLQHLLSNESLQLFPDFLQRKAVLRKLGYVDENETVCVKGRVACEVNTCEELIVTEMVFEGTLNAMEPEEIVAVLSALIYQEKKDEPLDAELPERLVVCCEQMKKIATNLGQLQKEQGLDVDPGEYCDQSLKFGLVHVVYEWALGVPFKNICELTDVQEGSIVRCITRLDELCREVRNCARVVGNPTLYRKVEAASVAIKRDIVFASSLYVS